MRQHRQRPAMPQQLDLSGVAVVAVAAQSLLLSMSAVMTVQTAQKMTQPLEVVVAVQQAEEVVEVVVVVVALRLVVVVVAVAVAQAPTVETMLKTTQQQRCDAQARPHHPTQTKSKLLPAFVFEAGLRDV